MHLLRLRLPTLTSAFQWFRLRLSTPTLFLSFLDSFQLRNPGNNTWLAKLILQALSYNCKCKCWVTDCTKLNQIFPVFALNALDISCSGIWALCFKKHGVNLILILTSALSISCIRFYTGKFLEFLCIAPIQWCSVVYMETVEQKFFLLYCVP